jgi:soluble lytic murein transglycosylase
MGRSAEVLQDKTASEKWYNVAAKYPIVFYGQLATLKTGSRTANFPSPSFIDKKDLVNYRSNELAKAAYIMLQIRENKLAKEFLEAAAKESKTPGERVLIAQMGLDRGDYGYSLHVSKDIYRITGEVIMNALFPVFNLVNVSGQPIKAPSDEYILSIMRQESEFESDAISPSGARGLMQIMPNTAQAVAKKLGLPFNKNRLNGDPKYNVTIGSAYLKSRLDLFDGSYVLATASYNAGEGNVKKWVKKIGDPRTMSLENVIDWIELIPFTETNNYVMRVLENMQIYRISISGKTTKEINLDRDLTR